MELLVILLLFVAAICFLAAALGATFRLNLVALGLLLWVLVPLINAIRAA